MKAILLTTLATSLFSNGNAQPAGYLTGVFLAIAILGYLTYSLIKPEKF